MVSFVVQEDNCATAGLTLGLMLWRVAADLTSVAKRVHCIGMDQAVGGLLLQQWRLGAFPARERLSFLRNKPNNNMMGLTWCLLNAIKRERKTKPSDLWYPFYQSNTPWPLLRPSCSLSCLLLYWLSALAVPDYFLKTNSSRGQSTLHSAQPSAIGSTFERTLNTRGEPVLDICKECGLLGSEGWRLLL